MTVLSADQQNNTFTIETSSGHHVSFDPASLKRQIGQSEVYRDEKPDLAGGEPIKFTASDRETSVLEGTFGTVERITEDDAISVRLDNRKMIELTPEKSC